MMLWEVLAATAASSSISMAYALTFIVRTHPWWDAQYFIPVLGMMLGNCISGISVGLSTVMEELTTGARPTGSGIYRRGQKHIVFAGLIKALPSNWLPMAGPPSHVVGLSKRLYYDQVNLVLSGSTGARNVHWVELRPCFGSSTAPRCALTLPAVPCERHSPLIGGGSASAGKDKIELLLSLGATRWEATREIIQRSIRVAITPVLNQMNVVGIVSIPGMMTGQILGGTDPSQVLHPGCPFMH